MKRDLSTVKTWGPELATGVVAATVIAMFLALQSPWKSAPDLALFIGRFHPLAVHLPIGILILVAVTESLTLFKALRARIDPAMPFVLPVLVLSAVGAFSLGLLLASGGGFAARLVFLHRSLTFAAVLGTALCYLAFRHAERTSMPIWRGIYRATLGATLGLLSIGAHFGGSITRGEGYLTKYAPAPIDRWLGPKEQAPVDAGDEPPPSEPLVYQATVAPILREHCVECHGSETTKAGLRLDSLSAIVKGGESGPALTAGQGSKSLIVTRMLLPTSDEEHMPPDGRAGPSADEIEVVRWWIDRGASEGLRVRDALVPPASLAVLARSLESSPPPSASSSSFVPGATGSGSATPPAAPSASSSNAPGASTAEPVATGAVSANATVYASRVAPVLASRCGHCHGAAKQKGKLRVDSLAALLAGGKSGPAVVAGSSQGTLLARVHLPVADDKHMPPASEAQITEQEVALVSWWAEHGADAETTVASLPKDLQQVLATPARPTPSSSASSTGAPSSTGINTASTAAPTSSATDTIDVSKLPGDVNLYRDLVAPILSARCSACHGASGPSANLEVEDLAALLAGGDSGPAIKPGDPAQSLLMQRLRLPANDSDHMPPPDMSQPTAGEIAALYLWIRQGAKDDSVMKTSDLGPDVLAALAQTMASAKPPRSGNPPAVPSGTASASATASSGAPHGESAKIDRPPRAEPGAGCASCTVGASRDVVGCLPMLLLAAVAGVRRVLRRGAGAGVKDGFFQGSKEMR